MEVGIFLGCGVYWPDVSAAIAAHVHLVVQLGHELGREDGLGQRLRQGLHIEAPCVSGAQRFGSG